MSVTYLLVAVDLVKSLRITALLHHSYASQCECHSTPCFRKKHGVDGKVIKME